jgi:hypothetical protein
MHGIRPIRSLDSQERYLRHFDHRQDHLTATSYLMIEANQWLAVRLDCILIILVTMLAFISIVAANGMLISSIDSHSVKLSCIDPSNKHNLQKIYVQTLPKSRKVSSRNSFASK